MKKASSTKEPLRESISVNFTRREAAALRRLGNRFGSRSDQVRQCLDLNKLAEKIAAADALAGDQSSAG